MPEPIFPQKKTNVPLAFMSWLLSVSFREGSLHTFIFCSEFYSGSPAFSKRSRKSVWTATGFDFAIMLLVGILFFTLARPIISMFSSDPALLAMGSEFLRITSFFYVFIAFGIVLGRGLGGAGDTFVPMVITLITLWGYLVPMAYYLSQRTSLGVRGIWWAMATSYAVHALLIIIWFETGMWRKKQPLTCKQPAE